MRVIGVRATLQRLREDRARLRAAHRGEPWRGAGPLIFDPAYQAVFLFRWSHFLFARGHRLLARLLWHANVYLTGADLSPISDIDGGLVLDPPLAVILIGKAGRDLTLRGHASIGGGVGGANIGAGPGLPVLGDRVVVDLGACVLGPVTIGDDAYIGPRCFVRTDVPSKGTVLPIAPKIRRRTPESAEPVAGALE